MEKELPSVKVVTVEQMRAIEQAADSQGLSYAAMMENAGRAMASWLERKGVRGKRILVLIGPGNNGGDGLVAARYLQQAGASVSLYCWRREIQDDENWDLVQRAGVPAFWGHEDERYSKLRRLVAETDWILDALLGTGVCRPIEGGLEEILTVVRKAVARRRASRKPESFVDVLPTASAKTDLTPVVVAVDVPSGLNCDTGAVDPASLSADVTVTFGFPKVGQFLFPGAGYVGELVIADIGFPQKLSKDVVLEVSTPALIQSLLPQRPSDGHKGTFGKVMVVAGSANYTGAAYLAASAAARVGAGLVTLGIAEILHPILASKLSEATFMLLPHEMGAIVPEAVKPLKDRLGGYDALLLGPGLGRDEKTVEFVARLLALPPREKRSRLGFLEPPAAGADKESHLPPLVIDADGLNALENIEGWPRALSCPTVLTPHPGEMARLLGITVADVKAQRIELACRAAQDWSVVVVLKGAYTVIASPPSEPSGAAQGRAYITPFANPVLATAGTGDVLAGAIAGLLAQGLPPFEAAVAGAYLHGLAGQMLGEDIGLAGAVASDLLTRLPLSIRLVAET
jgi:hydroxyethylthiazole kinase-like uncharacterized protein yjeF